MLCHRIKQFREYNKLEKDQIAEALGIDVALYNDYENGRQFPSIDIIEKLARCYKVSTDEFRGHTPLLSVYTKENDIFLDEPVDETLLKMSDLSWDEANLILLYRNATDKEQILKIIFDESEK